MKNIKINKLRVTDIKKLLNYHKIYYKKNIKN